MALRAKEAPGSELAPTWLTMLDAPLDVDDEGLEQQLESLANLTDIAAAHAARSLHALAHPHAVPARPHQALQSAVSRATLAAAATSAWAACPTFNRPAVRQELTKFVETVASRFASSLRAPDADHQTLKDIQQLLVHAERDGVTNWRAVAIDFFKDGDLPVAFTNSFAPVRDLRGLRQALWDGVEQHLVSPGERRQAVAVLKRSLASRLGQRDRTADDWFLAGALQPTDHLRAVPQGQVALSPPAAGMVASASVGFQPVSPSPATRAVRILHLSRVDATELSSVMSYALGVPIFITPADHSRGFGFAAVPEAKCAEIFLGESVARREYVVAPGKSVTLAWRSATTNEPFALAAQQAVTTPPSQRQTDSPEKSSNKRRLRQPAPKASKKARGQQAAAPGAAAPTRTLTTATLAPSVRGLGPTRPTRGRDIPRHAVGHLAPAMTGTPSAPAPPTGPPALGSSHRVHPPGSHAVDPAAGSLGPAWRPHGRAGQAAADDGPLGLPCVHPLWHAPRPPPPALPLLPPQRPSFPHHAS